MVLCLPLYIPHWGFVMVDTPRFPKSSGIDPKKVVFFLPIPRSILIDIFSRNDVNLANSETYSFPSYWMTPEICTHQSKRMEFSRYIDNNGGDEHSKPKKDFETLRVTVRPGDTGTWALKKYCILFLSVFGLHGPHGTTRFSVYEPEKRKKKKSDSYSYVLVQ